MGNPDRRHRKKRKRRFTENQFSKSKETVENFETSAEQSADDDIPISGEEVDATVEVEEASDSDSVEESDSEEEEDAELCSGNRIIDMSCLQSLVSATALCSSCKKGKLTLLETRRYGLINDRVWAEVRQVW
eukprot:scpid80869/ scgid20225/ 